MLLTISGRRGIAIRIPTTFISTSVTRLAQIFDVKGLFEPTKASMYLKRVGTNPAGYFALSEDAVIIDATNFSSITEDSDNKIIFNDTAIGFTGNGYLQSKEFKGSGQCPSVNYHVKSDIPRKYNLYLRGDNTTSTFKVSILIDGIVTETLHKVVRSDWRWYYPASFVLPDTDDHVLGLRIEENNNFLDKIYITKESVTPSGVGPDYTASPYVSLHVQIYETKSGEPSGPLQIYDWKTTLDEVITDDWYNFDINPISSDISVNFNSTYAVVLSATGGDDKNFVVWELVDNDEYLVQPSAIKI